MYWLPESGSKGLKQSDNNFYLLYINKLAILCFPLSLVQGIIGKITAIKPSGFNSFIQTSIRHQI